MKKFNMGIKCHICGKYHNTDALVEGDKVIALLFEGGSITEDCHVAAGDGEYDEQVLSFAKDEPEVDENYPFKADE